MSAASAEPKTQKPLQPCARTRAELDSLIKEHFQKPLWDMLFFTNGVGSKLFPPRDDLDPNIPRCLKCGCTIDEHSEEPAAKKLRTEIVLKWDKIMYANVKRATVVELKDVSYSEIQDDGSKKMVSRDVRFLKTAGGMPWFGAPDKEIVLPSDELLIRKWHEDLWETQKSRLAETPGVIVAGTPGIGKTMALNYFLHKYLNVSTAHEPGSEEKKRYIALILPNARRYYIFDTMEEQVCDLPITKGREVDDLIPFYSDLFLLHDLGAERPMTPSTLPTVVATSPNIEKYNEFSKSVKHMFYAPLLDNIEMEALARKACPSFSYAKVWAGADCKSWQEAAFYYGNVPRSVFSTSNIDQGKITKQLADLTLTSLAAFKGSPTIKVNDLLVELIPSPDYTDCKYRYRLGYVTDEIAFKTLAKQLDQWEKIVEFTTDGHIFEAVLHRFLAKFPEKLRLDGMKALHPPSPQVPCDTNAALRKLWPSGRWTAVPFSANQKTVLTKGAYYYPTKANFAVIDSFIFSRPTTKGVGKGTIGLVCFQMTLQKSHEATGNALQKFIDEFCSCFTLDGSVESKLNICVNGGGLVLEAISAKKTESYPLELHLIYLTKDSKLGYQNLRDGTAPETQIWKHVKQHACSTKDLSV